MRNETQITSIIWIYVVFQFSRHLFKFYNILRNGKYAR